MSGRILIIDDDLGFSKALAKQLRRLSLETSICPSAKLAQVELEKNDADVIVLDYQLPEKDGLSLLDELKAKLPEATFLMATAYPDFNIAVQAMKRGAFDYVAKDAELQECALRIQRAAEVAMLKKRVTEVTRQSPTSDQHEGLIGNHPSMGKLRQRIEALKDADETTVLITGETGTGKGVIARLIHDCSKRNIEPFISVDCTTIPETLVESELFGHTKGAFTGAEQSQMGRVEAAGKGSLFLDEIGELNLPIQSKLLRLLEEREFSRVGSTRTQHLQARLIAATNRNLEKEVSRGRFRADLRYRLEVFHLETPPLRDRGDDIFLLISHFLHEHCKTMGKKVPKLHSGLLEVLPQYPFPGNVRELKNMVEQAILLGNEKELTLDDFPVLMRVTMGWRPEQPPSLFPKAQQMSNTLTYSTQPPNPYESKSKNINEKASEPWSERITEPSLPSPKKTHHNLDEIRKTASDQEKALIIHTLTETKGNVSHAARQLGLSRNQIMRRIKKYGLK